MNSFKLPDDPIAKEIANLLIERKSYSGYVSYTEEIKEAEKITTWLRNNIHLLTDLLHILNELKHK